MTIIESRQVYINSANQQSTDPIRNTSIQVNLDKPIDTDKYDVFCSLIDSQIPNVIYTCDGTTSINFTITTTAGGQTANISKLIPAGNYSANQADLATIMTTAVTLNAVPFTVVFSYQVGTFNVLPRFTVHVTGTGVVANQFSITINSQLLGMNFNNVPLPINNPTATSTGQALPRLRPNYLLLNSSFSTNNQAPGSRGQCGIISKIPLQANTNAMNHYFNQFTARTKIGSSGAIQSFNVSLLDDFGLPPLFYNAHWSVTLQFDLQKKYTD